MNQPNDQRCPECEAQPEPTPALDRRDFLRALGGSAAAVAATTGAGQAWSLAAEPAVKPAKPAEALIQELYTTLTDSQRKTIALPWTDPARIGLYNSALKGQRLGQIYSKPQQELIGRILRSIVDGEEGYRRISRNDKWDSSGAFENCGCHLFGEAVEGKQFSWVFSGHHLTLRCDSDLKDGVAWGGPIYYGHSADGHSETNVYNYQTRGVTTVFKSLDEKQRAKALVAGNPGDRTAGLRPRPLAGITAADLNAEQRQLVEKVMRDILSPFRKEDGDEVMQIIKSNGGLEKIHLAFFRDQGAKDSERWHYWRLEGPGFIWNYRVLPHVHCYVTIANAKV
jgi:hypothetical protein